MEHDVKPRVLRDAFSTGFGNACAQTKKLSASNTVRKKCRLAARSAKIDAGKVDRKNWHKCALRSKPRSRRILSKSADTGAFEVRVAVQLGGAFRRLRQRVANFSCCCAFRSFGQIGLARHSLFQNSKHHVRILASLVNLF